MWPLRLLVLGVLAAGTAEAQANSSDGELSELPLLPPQSRRPPGSVQPSSGLHAHLRPAAGSGPGPYCQRLIWAGNGKR